MTADPTLDKLRGGDYEAAWSLFVDRHRRLLFAIARRYSDDDDDVMDLFAHMCDQLRANDLARLRRYASDPSPRASFSTWLAVVARNLCVDWIRARDGRRRLEIPSELSERSRQLFEYLFVRGYSHREAFELMNTPPLSITTAEFRKALRDVHAQSSRGLIGSAVARRVSGDVIDSIEADGSPITETMEADARRVVQQLLRDLPADLQLAIQLFVVEDAPAADIARALGWANAKAVYNRVYRALATVKDTLAARGITHDDL
jgi:RNA polymerase sigma factor (sigma-70 family)